MARRFRELAEEVEGRPGAKERIEAHLRATDDAIRLADLRERSGKTQRELAEVMEVTQENISRIERADDAYLSTLAGYVSALGGRLELNAVFPDEVIPLGALSDRVE